jgi:transposase
MSLNGNDCVQPVRQAKTEDLKEFMQRIRSLNNDGRPIGIVLDNAAIHKAKALLDHCCQLDIHLIRLPVYSPELNPIEYLWKDGKKELSKIKDFDQAKSLAPDVFYELMDRRKHSYAKAWKQKFINSDS